VNAPELFALPGSIVSAEIGTSIVIGVM